MKCKECGNEIASHVKFCSKCGAKVEAEIYNPGESPVQSKGKTAANSKVDGKPKAKAKSGNSDSWFLPALITFVIIMAVAAVAFFIYFKFWGSSGKESQTGYSGDYAWETEVTEDPSVLQRYESVASEAHLILYAEDTEIAAEEAEEVELFIRIPQTMELTEIMIMQGDAVLTTIDPAYLEATDETVEIGAYTYRDYKTVVTIPAAQEGETAVILQAEMGEDVSAPLNLYRDITVTDEMVSALCGILDETLAYVNGLGEPVQSEDGREGFKMDPSMIPEKVAEFLESRDDVMKVWLEDAATVRFVTRDGLSSYFAVNEEYDNPEDNWAGSGIHVKNTVDVRNYITDSENMDTIFEYDESFRKVAVDPDVLLMCPVREAYTDRDGYTSENTADKLAEAYGGTFTLSTDENRTDGALNKLGSGDLTDYGTVMLVTHGSA